MDESTATNSPGSSKRKKLPNCKREAPKGIDAEWSQVNQSLIDIVREASSSNRFPILMSGPPGTGKTSLAACVYRSIPQVGKWFRAQELIRDCQSRRRNGTGEKHWWKTNVDEPYCLFVDDIGLRTATDSAFEIMFELLDRRQSLPAVYTSNLPIQELAKVYDSRVASRLSAGTVIQITGSDRRVKQMDLFKVKQ